MIEQIENEFAEAVDTRIYLNSTLWKRYNYLSKAFAFLFDTEYITLKKISDINHYRGGWPSASTPPRIETLFQNCGIVAKYFTSLGRMNEINAILRPYGFELKAIESQELTLIRPNGHENKITRDALKVAQDLGLNLQKSQTPAEVLRWFIEKTDALQGEICERADHIKIDIYQAVAPKINGTTKYGFSSAVNISAAKKTRRAKLKTAAPCLEKAANLSHEFKSNAEFITQAVKAS